MRLFFAFELPEPVRDELADFTDTLRRLAPREVKWVESGNLHITLQFLGDLNDADVPALDEYVSAILRDYEAFDIHSPRTELIPGNNPRIIWVGYRTEYRHIFTLPGQILHHLEQQGYRDLDRKPLKLHATLGRISGPIPTEMISTALGKQFEHSGGRIGKISLYKSDLLPRGPIYTQLYEYSLL
jgi:RNA 2',3'-cyclic 3'-phosphodiesterase